MIQNPTNYKLRPAPKKTMKVKSSPRKLGLLPVKETTTSPINTSADSNSPCQDKAVQTTGIERTFTFEVKQGAVGWNLRAINSCTDAIPPEPVALNEGRLLCREAMTLITEEVRHISTPCPHIDILTTVGLSPSRSPTPGLRRIRRQNPIDTDEAS